MAKHGDLVQLSGGVDVWTIAAEGRSVQECQKAVEVSGAGIEHMFCRVEMIAGKRTTTPRQVLLWGAPRGRRPKVAAEDLGARMPSETKNEEAEFTARMAKLRAEAPKHKL